MEKLTEIKLGLLIIGVIVLATIIAGAVICIVVEDSAKDIMVPVIGVAGSAISGILGWMGRGLYDAFKKPTEEVKPE